MIIKWLSKWFGAVKPEPQHAMPTIPTTPPQMKITDHAATALRGSRHRTETVSYDEIIRRMVTPYKPPKGVLPEGHKVQMALDAGALSDISADPSLVASINDAFDQGYAFPGFSILAQWAQISEYRKPSEIIARETVRNWIRIQAAGDDSKTDKVKAIEAEFKKLNAKTIIRRMIEQDGLFGRSQLFFDLGDDMKSERDELIVELVESVDKVNRQKPLKRLVVVEPIWSYPNRYNADNPLDSTFYRPTSWFVMGLEISSTRLATLVTRQTPDILKPAYAFAGLSLSQMMKPYIDNWLRTRQSVSDLLSAFTVWTLKTNMGQILNGGAAQDFINRLQLFNVGRDNHGINAIDKDTEDFTNVSVPLGGLDHLQAQSQEHMCAPCGIPLAYLTGITPSGLNATAEGEITLFQDYIAAIQEIVSPIIQKIMNLVQLSLFDEIDPDITFSWIPLRTMTTKERAEIRTAEAQADSAYIDAGVLTNEEVRERIANDPDSLYPGLDLSVELPNPHEEEDEGQELFGGQEHNHFEGARQ